MPKLVNQALYDCTYQATTTLISSASATINMFQTELPANTPLYRYSSQQYSDGSEAGARKNWTSIDRDTGNRWTGIAGSGAGATGGLYMSLEAEGYRDTEFSELYHYQDQDSHTGMTGIEFFEYKLNGKPDSAFVQARTLYYMFMFFLQKPLKGIDLTLGSPAIENIYATAKGGNSSHYAKSANELYMDSDDASFCRAIGNGCFQDAMVDFITVTSTRNTSNKNIILRCEGGVSTAPMDSLKPAGRSSFFLHGDGSRQAEVTTDDMKYNAQFGT